MQTLFPSSSTIPTGPSHLIQIVETGFRPSTDQPARWLATLCARTGSTPSPRMCSKQSYLHFFPAITLISQQCRKRQSLVHILSSISLTTELNIPRRRSQSRTRHWHRQAHCQSTPELSHLLWDLHHRAAQRPPRPQLLIQRPWPPSRKRVPNSPQRLGARRRSCIARRPSS